MTEATNAKKTNMEALIVSSLSMYRRIGEVANRQGHHHR
jgi:hypothetical protein